MSNRTYRISEIVGTSPDGIDQAIRNGVERVGQTLRHLDWFEVADIRGHLEEGEVIVVRNCGPFGALVPVFETRADGPYAVLNTKQYVSSDPGSAAGGVSLTFYERK